jgi:hypothetical protein
MAFLGHVHDHGHDHDLMAHRRRPTSAVALP